MIFGQYLGTLFGWNLDNNWTVFRKQVGYYLYRYYPNIVKILSKYYPDIVQILTKTSSIYCQNIVYIMPIYFLNTVQILSKKCPNIEQILPHSVQLGNFSPAWNLAILQVGPRSGMILQWGPATHHPTPALVENPTFMQYRRLEFGGCLKNVRGCLEGVWLVSARYKEGVWRVQRRCLRCFKIHLNRKYFWGSKRCNDAPPSKSKITAKEPKMADGGLERSNFKKWNKWKQHDFCKIINAFWDISWFYWLRYHPIIKFYEC